MIPSDVASSLRSVIPDQSSAAQTQQTQPVAPTQRIADVLSNLVPGQRIFAEIQAMLPNGSYRASVAQRDVTLALPFSAKPGDSLELEVAESDGKLTLAFVANRSQGSAEPAGSQSASTSLSSTGKMIGDLMQQIGEPGKRAPPALLNGNQPLLAESPKSAADLVPTLKQALSQSGMFYEAHQARWVAGQLPIEQLRQEPQGQLMPYSQPRPPVGERSNGPDAAPQTRSETAIAQRADAQTSQPTPGGNAIPREIAPLVLQQLDGLANQNFAWQGQVWPGQTMQWEIGDPPDERRNGDENSAANWQTRLKLALPQLGGIDASLRLFPDGRLTIRLNSDSAAGESQLRAGAEALQQQMAAAGLTVNQLLIEHDEPQQQS